MTDTPLIRRDVTADRGLRRRKHRHKVSVSTERVIECVGELPDRWTTHDVAKALNVSEHAVRTSIQWLSDHKRIREAGVEARLTRGSRKSYWVRVYEICPDPTPCDVALLNQLFLSWR